MSFNLPPGVTESMIPGNRPEDGEWDYVLDKIMDECDEMGFYPDDALQIWRLGMKEYTQSS